jgi:biotin synthase
MICEKLKKDEIVNILSSDDKVLLKELKDKAYSVKKELLGQNIYLRGIIEYSNVCSKNCYYCGLRKDNLNFKRYILDDDLVLDLAKLSHDKNLGSILIQSGELKSKEFTNKIYNLLKKINKITNEKLHVVLSCGEQSEDTFKKWFDAGAKRYLLRIETSDENLYKKIHPNDKTHSFKERIKSIEILKKLNYQTGSGILIGFPGETESDIAKDLLFLKNLDLDMVGMGPYVEHDMTPLFNEKNKFSRAKRFNLAIKAISILRIMMPDINIASSTALDVFNPNGRFLALEHGANVIMPNLTPLKFKEKYFLYDGKPGVDTMLDDYLKILEDKVSLMGEKICYKEHGTSLHFKKRIREC